MKYLSCVPDTHSPNFNVHYNLREAQLKTFFIIPVCPYSKTKHFWSLSYFCVLKKFLVVWVLLLMTPVFCYCSPLLGMFYFLIPQKKKKILPPFKTRVLSCTLTVKISYSKFLWSFLFLIFKLWTIMFGVRIKEFSFKMLSSMIKT